MVINYLKFLTKSTNQHGVHSPFIYQLVTKCVYQKSSYFIAKDYKKYRFELKNNPQKINITDFGKGSKIFKNDERKVKQLVSKISISYKYGLLLNRLVAYLNIHNALELGTSVGLGTAAMCFGNQLQIDTIEGCPQTLKIATFQFKKQGLANQINTHQGDFKNFLPFLTSTKKYDLIYFDGNHQKKATLTYFQECLNSKHNNSIFIFDDIYWSDGMQKAWQAIKNHPEVTVTVDLFRWGLVFFRKEQAKEHFKIRF